MVTDAQQEEKSTERLTQRTSERPTDVQATQWLTQRTSVKQTDAQESQTERLAQRTSERQNGRTTCSLVGWPSEGLRVR